MWHKAKTSWIAILIITITAKSIKVNHQWIIELKANSSKEWVNRIRDWVYNLRNSQCLQNMYLTNSTALLN